MPSLGKRAYVFGFAPDRLVKKKKFVCFDWLTRVARSFGLVLTVDENRCVMCMLSYLDVMSLANRFLFTVFAK